MNRENLEKLAAYLESLPEDYEHFGMQDFINGASPEQTRHYAKNNGGVHTCGTVACAVGHGPAAGIPFPDEDRYFEFCGRYVNGRRLEGHWPNWNAYSTSFFTPNNAEWEWCFGGGWASLDNSHRGAAARIRYLLDGNEPPKVDDGYDEVSFEADMAILAHVDLYKGYLV